VPLEDFVRRFERIIMYYNKHELTTFMAFETSLMISRFFINNDLKNDGFHFINFAIYISNLDIKEELKVKLKSMNCLP
jgi:hypothetical protein